MHCPSTIKDLLIFPASFSLSPAKCGVNRTVSTANSEMYRFHKLTSSLGVYDPLTSRQINDTESITRGGSEVVRI